MIVRPYIRRSKSEEGVEALSFDVQRANILREGTTRGWQLTDWYKDDGVGKGRRGKELERLLSEIKRGESLVVAFVDRLPRSSWGFFKLAEQARREGWTLECLDPPLKFETANDRLGSGVQALVIQWERERIGERISEALRAKAARGERIGGVPMISTDLAATILPMIEEHGLRGAARVLNEMGVPTPGGGAEWRASSLQRLVRRHHADAQARAA